MIGMTPGLQRFAADAASQELIVTLRRLDVSYSQGNSLPTFVLLLYYLVYLCY